MDTDAGDVYYVVCANGKRPEGGELPTVKLPITRAEAAHSKFLSNMIGDEEDETHMDEEGGTIEDSRDINVTGYQAPVIAKILEFIRMHMKTPMKKIEKPLQSANLKDVVNEPFVAFVESMTQDELYDVIEATNQLDVQELMDLLCAKLVTQMKGKTPEELRATFGIANDFTPEEEEAVMRETKWVEDAPPPAAGAVAAE